MTLPIAATGAASAAQAATAAAGTKQTDAAKQAEGFERLLLGELTRSLADSALPEQSSSAATNAYKDMLPDALTEALMAAGGLGLAKQFEEGLS